MIFTMLRCQNTKLSKFFKKTIIKISNQSINCLKMRDSTSFYNPQQCISRRIRNLNAVFFSFLHILSRPAHQPKIEDQLRSESPHCTGLTFNLAKFWLVQALRHREPRNDSQKHKTFHLTFSKGKHGRQQN